MTCKDCIHYAVCEDRERVEKLNQNCNPPPYIRDGNFSPIGCLVFKNKADFVEVIRCKDCKHLKIINKEPVYAECERQKLTFLLWQADTREHTCSYGERKDTE